MNSKYILIGGIILILGVFVGILAGKQQTKENFVPAAANTAGASSTLSQTEASKSLGGANSDLKESNVANGLPVTNPKKEGPGTSAVSDASGGAATQAGSGSSGNAVNSNITQPSEVKYSSNVFVNGIELTEKQMEFFKNTYGKAPVPGRYWYDSRSGLYGLAGGPSVGYISSGLNLGSLSSNSSGGNSGVYINGRELPQSEANYLSMLVGQQVQPGYYWLDANGDAGVVGYEVPLVNLFSVASASSGGGSGDNFWTSGQYSGGNYYTDSSGAPSQGYVSVPGYGPVGYGF